ncbi:Oxysterol-binding protein [Thozetella sp. PMI_491]|nr:Oxysterol-binding protein [Thozetella sp. PMI_491]
MEKSSRIGELLKFLSSIRGDISNITAPPFFLAPQSLLQVCSAWAERPSVFAAAAKETTPEKRALLVLKWLIVAMRPQFYVAGGPGISIKKPLNPFLGEVFLASWANEAGTTVNLAAEQVVHHPPVSAVYVWDEENGIRATGYTRMGMHFSGTLKLTQNGHGEVHFDKYDEHYITPGFNGNVKGFLSGRLYPEISGTYHIFSTSGFDSELKFSGEGLYSGKRNSFEAKVYRRDDPLKTPIYEIEGQWSGKFTIKDSRTNEVLEVYDTDDPCNKPVPSRTADPEHQDSWESGRAWGKVLAALQDGRYGDAALEKSKVEKAQREMRAAEAKRGDKWQPLLFAPLPDGTEDELFSKLAVPNGLKVEDDKTKGVWKIKEEVLKQLKAPFRGSLTPLG